MAVTVDGFTGSSTGTGTANSLTWAHTVAAGATLLIVTTHSVDAARTISGVTYGGAALTKLGSVTTGNTGPDRRVEVWYRVNPTPGTANVTFTISGTATGLGGTSSSWFGVSPSSPFDTPIVSSGNTSPLPTHNVPSNASEAVLSVITTRATAPGVPTGAAATTSQAATGVSPAVYGAAARFAGAANVAVTWTMSTADNYAIFSVALQPPVAYAATPGDTAAATDATPSRAVGYGRTAADVAAGTDAAVPLLIRNVFDTAAATDATPTAVQNKVRDLAETAQANDTITSELTHPDIDDYQFVIPIEPWLPFGVGQTVVVERFDPGTAETRPQDVLSPVADVRYFGTDRRTPPTWSFDLYTDVENAEEALGWAAKFEAVWDQEEVRSTPGAVLPLRYKVAGRIRRVYGRPRNFALVPNYLRTGRVSMLADFELAENTFYDDLEHVVPISPRGITVRSGVTFPITFPMVSAINPEPRDELITIGGTRPTWVDLRFYGPTEDPWVQIGGQRWGLRGSILSGMSVTLSGLPWAQGVFRSDGLSMAGMLDPRARLSQLRLAPGTYTATLGGSPSSTQARVEVAWRNANGAI